MTPSMDLSGVSASLSSMDSDKIAGYLLAALSLIAIAATVAVAAFTSHGTLEALPILTLPFSVTGFLSYLYRRQWLLFVFSLAVCAVLYVLYPAAGIVAVFLLACTRGIALVASILQKRLFVPVMGSIERSGIGSGRMFSNRLAQSFFGIPPNVDTRVLRVERTVRRKGMPWPEIVDTMVMALAPSLLVWTALFAIWSFHITVVDAYTAVLTLSVLITMLVMPWLVLRSLNVRVGTEGGGMSVYKGLLGTSAHAAAEYLKDAYRIFGDWNLAIAAYNCGAGNVNRAIRRSGGSRNFWDIYPYLPRETRGYVPAFVGALYTMTYYKEHGIEPAEVGLPAAVDTFHIHKMLHFKQVSAMTGIAEQDLKNLNPQYRHGIIPGNDREYILRIPYSYSNAFIDHEDSLYAYKADEYFNPVVLKKIKDGGDGERIIHRVRSGEVLGRIAIRYHVTVSQIKRWNNLRSDNIRIGQRLVIYRGGNAPASVSRASSAASSQPVKSSIDRNSAYTIYVVKSGDSLYNIAKNYPGVSAQNIMDFNGISSKIKPGMKIKIPKLK